MAKITIEIDGQPVAITPEEARRIYGELAAIFAPPVQMMPYQSGPVTVTWNQPVASRPVLPYNNIILNRDFFDQQ